MWLLSCCQACRFVGRKGPGRRNLSKPGAYLPKPIMKCPGTAQCSAGKGIWHTGIRMLLDMNAVYERKQQVDGW